MLVVAVSNVVTEFLFLFYRLIFFQTENGVIFMYTLGIVDPNRGVYNQTDSPFANLKRDSAELFVKETIPSLTLNMVIKFLMIWFG